MKIKPQDADRFLNAPPPGVAAIVIFGPDEGLVHERIKTLTDKIVGTPADPMRVTEILESELKADPARLADEAAAMSLIPGDRIVRVRGSGEVVAKSFKNFLKGCEDGSIKPSALVVVEAGDLSPRVSLRKTAEDAKNAAAIACYADDARSLGALIRSALKEHGIGIEPDAVDLLTTRLGADRGVTRQEIEKLALYKGSGTVNQDDVEACLPADSEGGFVQLADIVAGGLMDDFDRRFHLALQSGQPASVVLRGVANHFQTLHQWSSAVANGASPGDIVNRARPPLHFKRKPEIERQLRIWSRGDVETALTALADAERQSRTTGLPDTLICHRTLLSLTRRAARRRR